MGEVYRARNHSLGREVAIKLLPGGLASDLARLRGFEQEADVPRPDSTMRHRTAWPIRCVVSIMALVVTLCAILQTRGLAQQGPATRAVAIKTEALPSGTAHQDYHFQLETVGGTPPLHWSVVSGEFPLGMSLDASSGVLSGAPVSAGDFDFTVEVSDSGSPAQHASKRFTLHVAMPLLLRWTRPAQVNGDKIEGAVTVTDGTNTDFDLTVIVVAVNEIGKAFALRYEHLDLKANAAPSEIDFSSSVPRGAYVVHVDAVAEVPSKNAIYRQRLQTASALQVTVGP